MKYDILPEVEKIKSVQQLAIGMEMVYTGQPRGSGMFVPDIGTAFTIESESDIMGISIEIIERGRGWWPTKESFNLKPPTT